MRIICFLPETELYLFLKFFHFFIFQNYKNLIGWRINIKRIFFFFKYRLQLFRTFHRMPPQLQIKIFCK